jgi:S-adenosylmethionine synthetase
MKNIVLRALPEETEKIEIVERKGLGHPDTICDSIMETVSAELSKKYIEKFGFILHHNVDKALLIGGEASPKYGGGKITSPIELYLTGRATKVFKGTTIDVDSIAIDAAKNWLRENLPNLDIEKEIKIYSKLKQGSLDLVELFERFQIKGEVPLANDTSFGVGFAPFSELERIVKDLEHSLNDTKFKAAHPYVGEDIKIMGVRNANDLSITIALAFVAKQTKNITEYVEHKKCILDFAYQIAQKHTSKQIVISINTADDETSESVYITVTGTSAEAGDDGEVGRGNRVNGLITPYRPMSLEAAAGKNPISHVGKIYNTAADLIANRIIHEVDGVTEAYCYLVSQIGKPITHPQVADIRVRASRDIASLQQEVEKIVEEEIDKLPLIWKGFVTGLYRVC